MITKVIGLVSIQFFMTIYMLIHISFVLLEGSQRIQGQLSLLFGFQPYLLSGKTVTIEFLIIILFSLQDFLRRLNTKHIGG